MFAFRSLRRCPLCAQDAVRRMEARRVDELTVEVRLECGECGVLRRVVTSDAALRRFVRRIERDRRTIGSCAVGLTRHRTRRDFGAFARMLREHIVGADDFLAATRD
jgi:hypothetical protein